MQGLNVLMASYHCCIRVVKQSVVLLDRGVNVSFLHNRVANEDCVPQLPNQSIVTTPEQYIARAKTLRGVHVIHVHNEPNWLGWRMKEARPDLPVVFDCHDLQSIRKGEVLEDERKSMEMCDAFIFPSEGYRNETVKRYGLTQPTEVIYSMCAKHMLDVVDRVDLPRVNGVVYEGGLAKLPHDEIEEKYFGYRDLRPLIQKCAEYDIPVHLFPGERGFDGPYILAGADPRPTLKYYPMLTQLSRFDWGFIGCSFEHSQYKWAMPNKMFEYIAAGIPTLAMNAGEAGAFLEKNELGVHIRSLDEIPYVYDWHKELRRKVKERRRNFIMENQADTLIGLYNGLLEPTWRRNARERVNSG